MPVLPVLAGGGVSPGEREDEGGDQGEEREHNISDEHVAKLNPPPQAEREESCASEPGVDGAGEKVEPPTSESRPSSADISARGLGCQEAGTECSSSR